MIRFHRHTNKVKLEWAECRVLATTGVEIAISVNSNLIFQWAKAGDSGARSPTFGVPEHMTDELLDAIQWLCAGDLGRLAIESKYAETTTVVGSET